MPEALLVIPGIGMDARAFAPLVAEMSRNRPVQVALPIGAQNVPDMARNILSMAPPAFVCLGHGLGAFVAMELARIAPERITALVLVAASAQSELPGVAAQHEAMIVKAKSGGLEAALYAATGLDRMAPSADRDALRERIVDMGFDLGVETFVDQLRAVQKRPDQQRTMRQAKCRTLILAGALDPIYPVARHDFLATLMTDAELEVLPGTGHLVPLEMPLRLTELVREFMPKPLLLA